MHYTCSAADDITGMPYADGAVPNACTHECLGELPGAPVIDGMAEACNVLTVCGSKRKRMRFPWSDAM